MCVYKRNYILMEKVLTNLHESNVEVKYQSLDWRKSTLNM